MRYQKEVNYNSYIGICARFTKQAALIRFKDQELLVWVPLSCLAQDTIDFIHRRGPDWHMVRVADWWARKTGI